MDSKSKCKKRFTHTWRHSSHAFHIKPGLLERTLLNQWFWLNVSFNTTSACMPWNNNSNNYAALSTIRNVIKVTPPFTRIVNDNNVDQHLADPTLLSIVFLKDMLQSKQAFSTICKYTNLIIIPDRFMNQVNELFNGYTSSRDPIFTLTVEESIGIMHEITRCYRLNLLYGVPQKPSSPIELPPHSEGESLTPK